MEDVNDLVDVVFSGLASLVVEEVTDEGEFIRVRARTRDELVQCPLCGQPTGRVHGIHQRTIADVPADGRRVVVSVQVRRLVCPVLGCRRQTFREQVPGLIERYQRRTCRLADQLGQVVKELRLGTRLRPGRARLADWLVGDQQAVRWRSSSSVLVRRRGGLRAARSETRPAMAAWVSG